MSRLAARNPKEDGFTLIEVIVTIIATGIMGVIFINFMGTAMSKSSLAVERVSDAAGGEAVIETILADYVYEINRDPDGALATIKSRSYSTNKISVTMDYVVYDTSGNETVLTGDVSTNLKVKSVASAGILTTLLTKSRVGGSPTVNY
jgi:prepilin-type N-terminal cleavage/methylation domain-containing protein